MPRHPSPCSPRGQDGRPEFHAVRSGARLPIDSRDANALHVRSETSSGSVYKRYVTTTCDRDRQSSAAIRRALRTTLADRDRRLAAAERQYAAQLRAADAALPRVCADLRRFRYRGRTIQRIADFCDGLEGLDEQGRVGVHLWLDSDRRWPQGGRSLGAPRMKTRDWGRMSESAKREVLAKVGVGMLLVEAPGVRVDAVVASGCDDLRPRRGDNTYDYLMQQQTTSHDPMAQLTLEDGRAFCTPLANVVEAAAESGAFEVVTHWSNANPTTVANMLRVTARIAGVVQTVDVPAFRLRRFAGL